MIGLGTLLVERLANRLIDIKYRASPLPSPRAVLKRERRSPGAIEVPAVNHPGHKLAHPAR